MAEIYFNARAQILLMKSRCLNSIQQWEKQIRKKKIIERKKERKKEIKKERKKESKKESKKERKKE